MATWPVTLPALPLLKAYKEMPPETSIRSKMDAGPDKIRRRTTHGTRPLAIANNLTTAQVQIIDDFFNNTLANGSLRFDWTHPRTAAAIECRFTSRPSYVPLGNDKYRVSYGLEIMP